MNSMSMKPGISIRFISEFVQAESKEDAATFWTEWKQRHSPAIPCPSRTIPSLIAPPTHIHDYRGVFDIVNYQYRAVCCECGHDSGPAEWMDDQPRLFDAYKRLVAWPKELA